MGNITTKAVDGRILCRWAANVLSLVLCSPSDCVSVLPCSVLFCSVLFCSVLFCSVLFCSVLFCSVLFCSVLFCSVLFCSVLFCSVLFCSVLFCSVLFCSFLLICSILPCSMLSFSFLFVFSRPYPVCSVLFISNLWPYIFCFQLLSPCFGPRRNTVEKLE